MSNLVLLGLPKFTTKGKPPARLLQMFKTGDKSDVKIKYHSDSVFALHKSYLRQESEYFKDMFKSQKEEYNITLKFQVGDFEKVISCIYGYCPQINRDDVFMYFQLCKQLKIESLLEVMREDIKNNITQYNIFKIFQLCMMYTQRGLFQIIVKKFQQAFYKQMKNQQGILEIQDIASFRNLIKLHEQFKQKSKTQISYHQINNILYAYCQKYKIQDSYYAMRKELINQKFLSSTEFNQIFGIISNNSIKFNRQRSNQKKNFAQTQMLPPSSLNTSVNNNSRMGVSMMNAGYEDLKTQNTYLKKKVKQSGDELNSLMGEVENFKKQRNEDEKFRAQCQKILKQSKSIVDIDANNLNKLQLKVNKLEQQLSIKDKLLQKQNQEILKLKQQLAKIRLNPALLKQQQTSVEQMLVQSTIIPHAYLKQLVKPKVKSEQIKKKQYQPEIVEQCERIQFDISSLIVNKKEYHKLLKIIDQDSFSSYKLNLLYRATEMGTRQQDFFQKIVGISNILVLIKSTNRIFGGYISIELSNQDSQYYSDPHAYIFNLLQQRKFKPKSQQTIFTSEQYLICFGQDIMIQNNCLIEGGVSSWPSTFEGDKSLNANWLCGCDSNHIFQIEQLEVYQIGSAQLQMTM